MDIKELLRLSKQAEEHKKLTGPYEQPVRQARELQEAIEASRKQSSAFQEPSDIRASIEELRRISQQGGATASTLFGTVADANRLIVELADNVNQHRIDVNNMLMGGGIHSEGWRKMIELVGAGVPADKYLAQQFQFLSERSFLAQANLAGVDLAGRLANLGVAEELMAASHAAFEGFSTSYKNLFESFAIPETSILTLPSRLAEFPTNEFFNGAVLLAVTSPREADNEFTDEVAVVRDEIRVETTDLVTERLGQVDPGWIKMLEGARQSIRSDNPDRVRHSITSLRELSTHILHHLSPDDELRKWSNSDEHFHDGRPTRKARLQFIAREIDHGTFTTFVSKDIEAMIEMIKLFQGGTHAVESKLTEDQVAALIARVEGSILFLFTIAD